MGTNPGTNTKAQNQGSWHPEKLVLGSVAVADQPSAKQPEKFLTDSLQLQDHSRSSTLMKISVTVSVWG